MNKDQALGILRNIVSLVCGVLVGKGIITAEQATTITSDIMIAAPALIALGVALWEAFEHTDKAKVVAAESVPGVATVVVKDGINGGLGALAASPQHPNVVTESQNAVDKKNGASQ